MSNKEKRTGIKRIDYKVLNSTGRKVEKVSPDGTIEEEIEKVTDVLQDLSIERELKDLSNCELNKMDQQLITKYSVLNDEIQDFLDENPINLSLINVVDIDKCINNISKLRTEFRTICKEISEKDSDKAYCKESESTFALIKEYIIHANERKSCIRRLEFNISEEEKTLKLKKESEEFTQKQRAAKFLINEVSRLTKELYGEFSKERTDDVNDEEISRRKEDLSANFLKLDQLSTKFQRCLEIIPDDYEEKDTVILQLTTEYQELVEEKKKYEQFVNTENQHREISKAKTFQVSSLNIKLAQFKGYESDLDIYTFQYEFEKLYLKNTPKRMLPDLLKYNYLTDPALSLVKCLDNIDEMWNRLKKAYGDPKVLLDKKLAQVRKIGPLWKLSGERLKESLVNLINGISDLISLSKYHGIENKLYYGDSLEIIYGLMGEVRVKKWISLTCDEDLEEELKWQRLISFLEKELKVQQELSLLKTKFNQEQRLRETYSSSSLQAEEHALHHGCKESDLELDSCSNLQTQDSYVSSQSNPKCPFCDEVGHYQTKTGLIQYYACKKFVDMTPFERFKELRKQGLCYVCLFPGAQQNSGKHVNGACKTDFSCKHPTHDIYERRKHILVCHEHRNTDENKKSLETYKNKYILQRSNVPEFSKEIKLAFMTKQAHISVSDDVEKQSNDDGIINENGIYMLQKILVENKEYTLFFDTGCSDMVARYDAIIRIGSRAKQEVQGPITLGGVGSIKMESQYGIYQVRLPLVNGKDAVMAGVCLDKITNTFPSYPLKGEIENDIKNAYAKNGGIQQNLPKLPECIGGDVDFMIGTKYTRYHPEAIFSLPSGLTIYKSPFQSNDDIQGVIGGPHKVITAIDKAHNGNKTCQHAYLSNQLELFQTGYRIDPDVHLLGMKHSKDFKYEILNKDITHFSVNPVSPNILSASKQKKFEEVENAASEILYRCINCRDCQKCKNGERIESMSIKEEVEQDIINNSVSVDTVKGKTVANLPFVQDPLINLSPNKEKAVAIYNSQIKRLSKESKDREDAIKSEAKLQELGFVDYVENLTEDQQKKLKENPIQNYIPWSVVWKASSLSTPCRVVFNASLPTESGKSLNDILAKGKNNMNLLVEIIIRWRTHAFGFHSDVQKMYNTILLQEDDWCFQRYIWEENLDAKFIPKQKIIKTLIYGVKSSGNQAERGLRMTADLSKTEFPDVNKVIQEDIYVDDCISGVASEGQLYKRADELSIVLMRGGFCLKGFTFSGSKPLKELSDDGESINVAGMKWYSETDLLQLDVSPLNFAKRVRGKKMTSSPEIPSNLTRRQCLSKVSELFDLTGMITPITAAMKLDLHVLVQRKLNWDDTIPDELRSIWQSNFEMINELSSFYFNRAIIPDNAVSLDMDTIDCADASKSLICIAIYARFRKKDGNYSCQLIFSRSKLVPDGMSTPRAELFAANTNAHTGQVVKRAIGKYHKECFKLTDSQVTLHWLNNQNLPLKQWTRNRVVDILRFTNPIDWKYVKSADMPADLGTRKGATIKDVLMDSKWQNGYDWMKLNSSDFPMKSYEEIKSSCINASEESNELIKDSLDAPATTVHHTQLQENLLLRYQYSEYLIDPNKFRFPKVLRVLALVKRFISKCKKTHSTIVKKPDPFKFPMLPEISKYPILQEEEIKNAMDYFYGKATNEVKKFCRKEKYEKISHEKEGILYYSGRILPSQQITSITTMTDTMQDLSTTTFCVPLIESSSPLAYSIVNEIHWNHESAKHAGVETTLRYTMKYGFILDGRSLVKLIKSNCIRCKILLKRTLDVSMGPVSSCNLTVAPAFYISQTDIVGPFKSYSPHNKRNTIKVWFVVFCCTTTSTVSIKLMEDYTTMSFVQGFIRFSCEFGYPKLLLIDEGSQLVKGCEEMRFNFRDAQYRLNLNYQVEFQVCPVGGHNMHGKVERKIKSIRESISKSMYNERFSIIQWETVASQIANSVNDMPLALAYSNPDLEFCDIITPNRLRLGRNNERSPSGIVTVTNDTTKICQHNEKVFNSWFEAWLISHVPKLMMQPKWFNNDRDLKVGDIVLFLKNEKELCNQYQYGRVKSTNSGADGKIRSAEVLYRNNNEKTDRTTTRATRQLVRIHSNEDIDILQELGEVAKTSDIMFQLHHK